MICDGDFTYSKTRIAGFCECSTECSDHVHKKLELSFTILIQFSVVFCGRCDKRKKYITRLKLVRPGVLISNRNRNMNYFIAFTK